ncbi:VolA/Pla-1 family phospholipase [Shewanella surugensis]|uniref:Lipase n=1 Tax=Shewanella surugensis TaxID=212020 RepID=A0ABT0LBC9_9GAMM|nr:VolA/Pla-1 family phospholipase [Shewanella surugensis]MCL1124987.1 lipase [Shewanella surugensis]
MKKLMLSVAIASTFGLTACGEDSSDEVTEKTEILTPWSQIVFDPSTGAMALPHDLLLNGTTDGTLNIPGEESGDYTDPAIALGALDGWSTTAPIAISVELENDAAGEPLTISAASVTLPGAVRMFEAVSGGALSKVDECKEHASITACQVGDELVFGVDFVTSVSGNQIVIVPLKPLKEQQSYIYALTSLIEDSAGQSIAASKTYGLLKLDIDVNPLSSPTQLVLQHIVNSYEKGMAETHGVDASSITYSALFTTQSVTPVLETTKLLMADLTEGNPYQPALVSGLEAKGYTVAQALGMTPSADTSYLLADATDVYSMSLKLPIYSQCSSVKCLDADLNPFINGYWTAQGDSPVAVLSAINVGTLSQSNFIAQASAYGIDGTAALSDPALLAGKTWLLDDKTSVDPLKHLTQYNPIPAITGYETVNVQITMPNVDKMVALGQGDFAMPAAGWPTTIMMHGLGGGKEMMLATAGSYAYAGGATVAIDMPLHGERSFDANDDGIYDVTATDVSYGAIIGTPNAFINGNTLAFINVGSSLTARDNFRQAIVDNLALRLSLTGLSMGLAEAEQPQIFDVSNISVLGLSLGGIVGTNVASYASSGLVDPSTNEALSNVYALNAASVSAPAGGLAGSFVGSATFSPALYATVTADEAFIALVTEANVYGFATDSEEYKAVLNAVYEAFIPSFAFAVQTAVDSIDPINVAGYLAASKLPVQLIEVVGDGAGNLPDQVLPNAVASFPLSGTEPLISALGLACVDSTTVGSGVVRFMKGHHSSIVDPSEKAGITDGDALAATVEMQAEVIIFSSSAAKGEATIVVSDPSLVQACQ